MTGQAEVTEAHPAQIVEIAAVDLDFGVMRVHLDRGVSMPLVSAEGETVGALVQGTGTVVVQIPDPADATALAVRQWRVLHKDRAALTVLAEQSRLEMAIDRLVVIGKDDAVAPLLVGTPAAIPADAPALVERLKLLQSTLDVGAVLEPDGPHAIVDVRGERLGLAWESGVAPDEDRWMTGVIDVAGGGPLWSIGRDRSGRSVFRPVAPGPWHEPPVRDGSRVYAGIEPYSVEATLIGHPLVASAKLFVEGTAVFRMHVTPAAGSTLTVGWPVGPGTRPTWNVSSVTVNGVPVAGPPGLIGEDTVPLPEGGGDVELAVTWSDRWSMGDPAVSRGAATGLVLALPAVGGTGVPWPYSVKVGVPLNSELDVALTGKTARTWEEGGFSWVESTTDGAPAPVFVGVGSWWPGQGGDGDGLDLRIHLFDHETRRIDEIEDTVRRAVAYDAAWLAPLPVSELEFFEAADSPGRLVWRATQGLVMVEQLEVVDLMGRGMRSLDRTQRDHALAHEVAHQYWGSLVPPSRLQDVWISETLAELTGCRFLDATGDAAECARRRRETREILEQELGPLLPMSLRTAWGSPRWKDLAYGYGPYVLGHMLRGRIGDEAFWGAIQDYLAGRQGRGATDESLQLAFEARSGRDLRDFFDAWVSVGALPSLTLTWDEAGGRIDSDVPFVTIDVPVAIFAADGRQDTVWVTVADGKGQATWAFPPSRVRLDPDGMVLATKRRVRKG